jgi:hypothetical protein
MIKLVLSTSASSGGKPNIMKYIIPFPNIENSDESNRTKDKDPGDEKSRVNKK